MQARVADPIGDDGARQALNLAAGGYVGVVLAGVVTTAVALAGPPVWAGATPLPASTLVLVLVLVLVGTYLLGLVLGTAVGLVIVRRDRRLPGRLGRTRRRRLLPYVPGLPFAAIGVASIWLSIQDRVVIVAVGTVAAILIAGTALATVARTSYVEQVTVTEPAAVWNWEPPGFARLATLLFGLWLALGVGNALAGNWTGAIVWTTIGLLWAISCIVEGRWRVGSASEPQLQLYEAGLVQRRPYTATIVPWETIDRVWLREGELVLDRGFFDVRFDTDDLEDPDAVYAAIERRLSTGAASPHAAE